MRKYMIVFLFIFIMLKIFSAEPIKTEQVIYSLVANNGRDYIYTFSDEQIDTIYLRANTDNELLIRKTLVYYWPITEEWKTDFEALDYRYSGFMEIIEDGDIISRIPLTKYVYYAVNGGYGVKWLIESGQQAQFVVNTYNNDMNEYWQKISDYNLIIKEMNDYRDAMIFQIEEDRANGKDVSQLIIILNAIEYPEQPESPNTFFSPPYELLDGYKLNLPEGVYDIRFRTDDGYIVEGSEKRLVLYSKEIPTSIGYEIIPGDKWTRSVFSANPHSVIYLDGSTDLYLQSYYQDLYKSNNYQRTLYPHSTEFNDFYTWVQVEPVNQAKIDLLTDTGSHEKVSQNPYLVVQNSTNSLGYRIEPFSKSNNSSNDPTLYAIHIPISKENKIYHIFSVKSDGLKMYNSDRQIRIIDKNPKWLLFMVLSCIPLLIFFIAIFLRSRLKNSL